MPALIDAAYLLKEKYGCSFLLPVANQEAGEFIKRYLHGSSSGDLDITFIYNNIHKAMEKSDFLIISSGTATLEAAIVGKPMVIIYKIDIK